MDREDEERRFGTVNEEKERRENEEEYARWPRSRRRRVGGIDKA
jgi:hypothetical protein